MAAAHLQKKGPKISDTKALANPNRVNLDHDATATSWNNSPGEWLTLTNYVTGKT